MLPSSKPELNGPLARLFPALRALLGLSNAEDEARLVAADNATMERISLLSVVRTRGNDRYMGVVEIEGEFAECAWVEEGCRQSARFRLVDLRIVPALGADDDRWREAFRAVGHKRVG